MERAFYVSIHFDLEGLDKQFVQKSDDLFLDEKTNTLFRKRKLYDFGWGNESGFEKLPALGFPELIRLIEIGYTPRKNTIFHKKLKPEELKENQIRFANYYGAASVIMLDHIEEFIDFLSEKIQTDYFTDKRIRQYYRVFCFDTQKEMEQYGYCTGGILTESYEEVLNKYPKWRLISDTVKRQIYGSTKKSSYSSY